MSKQKRKGTDWEMAVLEYLTACDFKVLRMPPAGRNDVGDLHVYLDGVEVVLECKNTAGVELAKWASEVADEVEQTQQMSVQEVFGVTVHKRKMKNTGSGYVTMDLSTFAELLGKLT